MAFIVCALLNTVNCGSTPAAPTPGAQRLEIRGDTVFKTGDVGAFSVVLTSSTGSLPASSVTWKSDRSEVFAVDANGRGQALQPGTATVSATDGAREASVFVRVVPDVSGRWVGRAQNTAVRRISGQGPIQSPSSPGYYELRVDQVRDQLIATDWTLNFLEVLTGTVTSAGLLSLSGSYDFPEGDHVDTAPWTAQLDGQHLTGMFVFVYRFTNLFGPQVIEYTVVILDLTRA